MNDLKSTLRRLLSGRFRWRPSAPVEDEAPLRSALFGMTQLESHARLLASSQQVEAGHGPERLLPRLDENARIIKGAYEVVAEALRRKRHMAPAAEWLLDNYYLIEDQVVIAHDHLPPGYSRQLPRLRTGTLKGFPRVYELALELVSHTDGLVDMENLTHCVRAYQTVSPLKLGELWAVPIMLRLALLENLRRASHRIVSRSRDRDLAAEWAERFIETAQKSPRALITELADFLRADLPMSQAFIAELATGVHGQHAALGLVINWIEQDLAERGQTVDHILQGESHDQAADQISVGNSITSLRLLSGMDWRDFVESLSATGAQLRADPVGVYGRQDFRTRDIYRHIVEWLARRSGLDEAQIAATAVRLAAERLAVPDVDPRETHVGYFLIGRGRRDLERAVGYRAPIYRRLVRWTLRHAFGLYVLFLAVLSLAILAGLAWFVVPEVLPYGWTWLIPLGAGALLIVFRFVVTLVQWIGTLILSPRSLPRLDFAKGIPDECRTAVAVPAMLASAAGADRLVEDLEIRYLANRTPNLVFALLTDFTDAAQESLPEDEAILTRAADGIRALNERHAEDGRPLFFLLHRPRLWNPQERLWMGRERKRGKLNDLNSLILRGRREAFSVIVGDVPVLRTVRYVITLDADTRLPPEAGWKMVGAMAHPLNRPHVNPATGCVEKGFGLLQPRVDISLTAAVRSPLARLFAGEAGIDPYTREVSNFWQDLTGRGQFIGKGIYDVAAFEAAIGDRLPDNRILSHDLLEGCYGRCGFLNDVELIEDTPSTYVADACRRHRWVRGDWQIAAWLWPLVPGSGRRRVRNPLGGLSRWLILDNLRRSLTPPALLGLLLAAWLSPALAPAAWTIGLVAAWLLPDVLKGLWDLTHRPRKASWSAHLGRAAAGGGRMLAMDLLVLVMLPFEAGLNLDAIVRTQWRLWIRHRRLLQWQTADAAERNATSPGAALRAAAIAPLVAAPTAAALVMVMPEAISSAAVILVAWMAAPLVAWLVSRSQPARVARFTPANVRLLHQTARRTWAYFEHLATDAHHWLPPDNFQELPEPKVAARTSPTNIGLGVLAGLAACDFGFLSGGLLVDRTGKTLETLDRLRRYRGHFLNWYDTHTCEPLGPAYVSTVDSGNLACCMVTMAGGLREQVGAPILPAQWREGLATVLDILQGEAESAAQEPAGDAAAVADLRRVAQTAATESQRMANASDSLPAADSALGGLAAELADIETAAHHHPEVAFWLAAARAQADDLRADLRHLAPWLADEAVEREPPGASAPALAELREALVRVPTLADLAGLEARFRRPLLELPAAISPAWRQWIDRVLRHLAEAGQRAADRVRALEDAALACSELADQDMDFLYDPSRKLLTIGFSLEAHRRDPSYYDLLASEARLSSFLAIAKGKLPYEHWFTLGRQLAGGGSLALVSWSGSLFEYLMPLLLMPAFEGTLLERACRGATLRHMAYGRLHHIPWGISESCYNAVDTQANYQYRAFGVPNLGLKRGLADDLVVAPYASALALTVLPEAACANLAAMARRGYRGRYGFYEAVDFTPSRLPVDQSSAIVRCFMAHHGGMSLLALDHVLHGGPMLRRFEADPEVRAALLLLEERVPMVRAAGRAGPRPSLLSEPASGPAPREETIRAFTTADQPHPEVHILSNGHYHVMVTAAGSGRTSWEDLALTRWREDATRDDWGTWFFISDLAEGRTWSTTPQPLGRGLERCDATFSQARAEFRAVARRISCLTQISVSPEDDVELRRMTLTNRSRQPRTIELTSFAEVVLADPQAELSHPAFSNLFIQTETLPTRSAILCHRRPRAADETSPWMFHALVVRATDTAPDVSFETDRARFLGRGRTMAEAAALEKPGPLSGTAGAVLDPCVSVRQRLVVPAGDVVVVDAIMGVGRTRDEAISLLEKYRDARLADRILDLAWTHSQVLLHQLRATEADAQLFARLAGPLVYANARYRAKASLLARNRRGQSDLWRYAISGDLPIVLVRVTDTPGLALVRRAIQAHAYWRHKGLRTDLVIWADAVAGYRQSLLDQIVGLVGAGPEAKAMNQPAGIFLQSTDHLPEDDQVLLQAVARIVLSDRAGSLQEQADRRTRAEADLPNLRPSRGPEPPSPQEMQVAPRNLEFFNGLGGFTTDGREYVTILQPGDATPAPWSNVLANPDFGAVVTESGGGYTWCGNAHEYRLTPWYNDPVRDTSGEAWYVRDEETGRYWSPAPGPARGQTPYVCRHGLGYTAFEHTEAGIATEAMIYVATDAPVKCVAITLKNLSDRDRPLSVTGFVEWVLGETRQRSAMHVSTRLDPRTGAILATNPFGADFADRIAFFQASERDRTVTGDRTEFIGRNRTLAAPLAMRRQRLSNRVGAGMDPCAAIQTFLWIPAGQERQVVFVLGAAASEPEAHALLSRFADAHGARQALEAVWEQWKRVLGAVYIETPDRSVDFLANHWLLYQTLAGRFWGRTGFYQSGGAFGFRDQLQDAASFIHDCPWLLRQHLLTAAAHQFREGDVEHWWHPPTGRGLRTHCSDDYLWLPAVVSRYVTATGDTGVLDERVPLVEGRALAPDEEATYDTVRPTDERVSLYEHCVRALRRGLQFGSHGLPLIGSGDWNDGLNRVGRLGKGESVWLGFFMVDVLTRFLPLAQLRGDSATVLQCTEAVQSLRANLKAHAWDGQWFRRAYFDDGQPLGSASGAECRIDSLPQSWAVLSDVADPDQAASAMQAVMEHLVDREHRLIRLLDPPFDAAPLDPGYIKGYVPGVRENGGQYTHAAIWVVMAMARLRKADEAWGLLDLINPVRHGDTADRIARYGVEPYVVAADVYTAPGHEGRGGWTWYTGAAAWMYRLIIESLLGLRLEVDTLRLAPVVPVGWKTFAIHYRFRETMYHMTVTVEGAETWNVRRLFVDDVQQPDGRVHLVDDHLEHIVRVEVG